MQYRFKSLSVLAMAWMLVACSSNVLDDQKVVIQGGQVGGQGPVGGNSGEAQNPGTVIVIPAQGGMPAMTTTAEPTIDKNCGFQNYKLVATHAEVFVALDRSASMKKKATAANAGVSKWLDVTTALKAVLGNATNLISWGMKSFPEGLKEGQGPNCLVTDKIDVPVAEKNASTMISAVNAMQPEGDGTPTAQVMQKAVSYLKTVNTKNKKYIILATDGSPTCRLVELVGDAKDDAVNEIAKAAAAGFHTYVIGVATSDGAGETLNRMADAGLEPRKAAGADPTAPRYYLVSTQQELVDAMKAITGQIVTCTFPLEKNPPSPDDVAVKVTGAKVVRDTGKKEGWDYGTNADGTKFIEFFGSWCQKVKGSDGDQVDIIYGCPNVPIP